MKGNYDRRSFLRVAGTSFGIGALYSVFPGLTRIAGAEGITRTLAELNGEAPAPFSFVQLSDPHVGFNGPPDPLGTKAFETAVATINGLKKRPELVIITGDLTHDADSPDEHAKRFKLFKEISSKIGAAQVKVVPGENDAALDGGDAGLRSRHVAIRFRGALSTNGRRRTDRISHALADAARRTQPVARRTRRRHRPLARV